MMQGFNTAIAEKYGVYAAVIIDYMIHFCKAAHKCKEYKIDGKVFVLRNEMREALFYMPTWHFNRALNILVKNGVLQPKNNGEGLVFTDYAKELFSKKPIRIQIDWQ